MIAQCAEVKGPDADGFVWLRLARKLEVDTIVAAHGETAGELLRWRDQGDHKAADCAEVIGNDPGCSVFIRLVAGGKDTQVRVRPDQARDLLR